MQTVKLIIKKFFLNAFPWDRATLCDYSNKYTVTYFSECFKRTRTSTQKNCDCNVILTDFLHFIFSLRFGQNPHQPHQVIPFMKEFDILLNGWKTTTKQIFRKIMSKFTWSFSALLVIVHCVLIQRKMWNVSQYPEVEYSQPHLCPSLQRSINNVLH